MAAAAATLAREESAQDSDGSLTWEDFFGTTTAEDLVPTLLSMYDTLVGRGTGHPLPASGVCGAQRGAAGSSPGGAGQTQGQQGQLTRPPEPPPPPPPPASRPLSQASISSSSSSSSSSGGGSLCKRKAFLASIESLEDSGGEEDGGACRSGPPSSKAGSQGSTDSGVCSPRSYVSSPDQRGGSGGSSGGGGVRTGGGGGGRRDPQLSYTDRVVLEIIQTEQLYVDNLSQVIHGYIEQFETSSDCPISESQLHDLFGNIRQIYTFNSTFLRELEECGLDPVRLARVFVKNNSGFSVYTHYCTNYPRAVGALTGLMRDEGVVHMLRERQASLGHTLPLGSYLLKPVQRILKYHLLLQNMVKNCSEGGEGYTDVVTALSTMTGIAHHINDMKRKHEHAVRVQEIQSLLLGWQGEDLTRYGELCAEGTFRMAGAKALRHAFLFDQILLITKKKEEGILQYKAHIMCSNLMLIESIPGEPLCFHVIPFDNPRHQYTLQARSLEQKREWSLQLKRVILENYNAVIPSHARQLVMELGQGRAEDSERLGGGSGGGGGERKGGGGGGGGGTRRQHSAPEYLERRKQDQRRKSEGSFIRATLRARSARSSSSQIKEKLRLRRSRDSRGDESLRTSTESKLDSCGLQEENRISCTSTEETAGVTREPSSEREPSVLGSDAAEHQPPNAPDHQPPHAPDHQPPHAPEVTTRGDQHQAEREGEEKKKSIEEIVSQLLMQNKEFQRVLKKQRHITSRRVRAETSDEEDEGGLSEGGGSSRSLGTAGGRLPPVAGEGDYDNLWAGVKRTRSFTTGAERDESSPEISLSGSRDSFGPNCPAVWLKQQRQHLIVPVSTKAGSLPRGFMLGTPVSDWARQRVSPDRPFTIASDKAGELNLEDMERYVEQSGPGLARHRFPLPPDETEDESTPDQSTHDLVHPEHRIYRASLTKATIKQVISSVSQKLANLRLSSETLDQTEHQERASRLRQAFTRTFKQSRSTEEEKTWLRGGSRTVGARMANSCSSDYADPRTLFPTITRSRKAASLLGIRPYSSDLPVSSASSSTSGCTGSIASSSLKQGEESDGSADSFYERSFDAIESTMTTDVCRDSAVFSESDENSDQGATPAPTLGTKKTPPPVPEKPPNLKLRRSPPPPPPLAAPPSPQDSRTDEEYDSSSVASTVIENTPATNKGWVKHVICKIQGDQSF